MKPRIEWVPEMDEQVRHPGSDAERTWHMIRFEEERRRLIRTRVILEAFGFAFSFIGFGMIAAALFGGH